MVKQKESIFRFNGSDFLKKYEPKSCFIERLEEKGKAPQWVLTTVGDIWISSGPKDCQIHAMIGCKAGGHELRYEITKEDYNKFIASKGEKSRIRLLLQKSRNDLRKKKITADRRLTIRIRTEVYDELSKNAALSKKTMAKYAREILEGKQPIAALSEEEKAMMKEVANMRKEFIRMESALIGFLKGKSKEERLTYLVQGRTFDWWRIHLVKALNYIDGVIDKHK